MRRFLLAVLIAALAAAVMLAGCGGGGGGGSTTDPTDPTNPTDPPLNPTNVVLTGYVLDNRSPARPILGVVVRFGDAPNTVTGTTDSTGKFELRLPSGKMPYEVFSYANMSSENYTFSVDSSAAATPYRHGASVYYYGVPYLPAAVSVKSAPDWRFLIYSANVTNLGTITIQYSDPDMPPPGPW